MFNSKTIYQIVYEIGFQFHFWFNKPTENLLVYSEVASIFWLLDNDLFV